MKNTFAFGIAAVHWIDGVCLTGFGGRGGHGQHGPADIASQHHAPG